MKQYRRPMTYYNLQPFHRTEEKKNSTHRPEGATCTKPYAKQGDA
ncbi:MAG: hypothetical protein ACI3Z9_05045 [Candidatus Onthomorpha sp.]